MSRRLGFIGLGKYGYATLEAILKSQHFSPHDIVVQELNEKAFEDNPIKLEEVRGNYSQLGDRVKTVPLEQLVDFLVNNDDGDSVFILSLNKRGGEKILKDLGDLIGKHHLDKNKSNRLWIFSSISHMSIDDIYNHLKISKNSSDIRVVRYIENMGIKYGVGIISAYGDDPGRMELVVRDVFYGTGYILFHRTEDEMEKARVITGSTIGLIVYMAEKLEEAICKFVDQADIDHQRRLSADIVYMSMAGALALGNEEDITSWRQVLERKIKVLPGVSGQVGTTEGLIRNIEKRIHTTGENEDFGLGLLIYEAYNNVIKTYILDNHGKSYEQ